MAMTHLALKPVPGSAGRKIKGLFPEEKCPVCGRRWIRYCRRGEWGYWYKPSASGALTLLCSGECSKKYAEQRFMEDVRRVASTRYAQEIRLCEAGMKREDAIRAVGLRHDHGINQFEDLNWKELDWLRAHNWEVPA